MKRIDLFLNHFKLVICNKVFGSNKTGMSQIQLIKKITSPQFCSLTFCKYCFDKKKENDFVCFFNIYGK